MTREDKADFCILLSSLFAPPDEALIELLRGEETIPFLQGTFPALNHRATLSLLGTAEENHWEFLRTLQVEYRRLFSDGQAEGISLVESTYKPWTQDRDCAVAFAGQKGLLLGDCALHLAEVLRRLALEVPAAFKGTPDHLVIELEILSFLYRMATDEQIRGFIQDHLDWIPGLKTKALRASPHPFYQSAIELLDTFLRQEKEDGQAEKHGS